MTDVDHLSSDRRLDSPANTRGASIEPTERKGG